MKAFTHIPVLKREIIGFIKESPSGGGGTLVDCTLGEGGHSEAFLKEFPEMKIIAFERDSEIFERAKERLKQYEERTTFVNDNFSMIGRYFENRKGSVDCFLFDYGISSFHIDESGRGFAFKSDEILDMRLDKSQKGTAKGIVNTMAEKDLANLIYKYGEERFSRRIARRICEIRADHEIATTKELAEIVLRAMPRKKGRERIHPATRTFQALRIAVNNELEAIKEGLYGAYGALKEGGTVMAISFHSLEDRIVKQVFRRWAMGCMEKSHEGNCLCVHKPYGEIVTKKPVTAKEDEVEENNRSRSAKLRVCRKTAV